MCVTFSPAGLGLLKHAPGKTRVWSCTLLLEFLTVFFQWLMRVVKVVQAGLASTYWVGMGDLSTWGFNTIPVVLRVADTLPASPSKVLEL